MLFVKLKLWVKEHLERGSFLWNVSEWAYKEINDALRMKGRWGVLPDFVICGTQKGGTTSLYHYLIQHPEIYSATTKEIHYFDTNFEKEEAWYRSHFPSKLWKSVSEKTKGFRTGEASPYYMFHPAVPERLSEVIPDAKLIFVLRDPIERACSHYNHAVSRGEESRPFNEAIGAEASIAGDVEEVFHTFPEKYWKHSYIARGRYSEQLKRFKQYFSDDQILLVKSEDLFKEPKQTSKKVFDFLGVDEYELSRYHAVNDREYSVQMSDEALHFLKKQFSDSTQELYKMTGIDFRY